MNKILILLSLCLTVHLSAEDLSVPNVAVVGTATIDVTPDKMLWDTRVEIVDNDVGEVAKLHDQKVSELLAFLKSKGIEEKMLQTSEVRLSENRVRRNGDYVQEGYRSSTSVAFETTDIALYRELWIGIAEIPNVSINEVVFDVSDRIKYQNESRISAVKVAKKKAESLAAALGATVHEPLLIKENPAGGGHSWNANAVVTTNVSFDSSSGARGAGTSLSLGTISISSRVGVTFRISNN